MPQPTFRKVKLYSPEKSRYSSTRKVHTKVRQPPEKVSLWRIPRSVPHKMPSPESAGSHAAFSHAEHLDDGFCQISHHRAHSRPRHRLKNSDEWLLSPGATTGMPRYRYSRSFTGSIMSVAASKRLGITPNEAPKSILEYLDWEELASNRHNILLVRIHDRGAHVLNGIPTPIDIQRRSGRTLSRTRTKARTAIKTSRVATVP